MNRPARQGERGIGLIAIAVWIVALAVMMAAAIDIARLSHTAGEVQAIADAAALAGAKAIYDNGGIAGPEVDAARRTGNVNTFDGKLFPLADDSTGVMTVEAGSFNGVTFVASGTPSNAVRAVATGKDVQFITSNLMGAFLGNSATGSDVTKEAIAAFGCGTLCQPQLPVVLCDGLVQNLDPNAPCGSGDITFNGPIAQVPSPLDTSCWSCLTPGCGANTQGYL